MITRQAITLLIVLIFVGCEVDTKVRVTRENPPKFILSGSGILAQMYVSGPFTLDELRLMAGDKVLTKEEALKIKQAIRDNRVLWQLDPGRGKYISDLSAITYGEIPKGFKQIYPKDNISPPPLHEGKYYSVYVPTYNANHRTTDFMIKNGGGVEVSTAEILKPDSGHQ